MFHAGCVIGDAPQDLKYKDAPTRLSIGRENVFREQATIHRSNKEEEATVLGDHCFFMVNSHVGHNCHLGNHVIVANGALVAGHAQVADRVFISGNCLIHQFVRIGTLALMQGGSAISRDLPPYTVARGGNRICGLNTIGLRRAGLSADDRAALKALYHELFRSGRPLGEAMEATRKEFTSEPCRVLLAFLAASRRGVCIDFKVRGDPRDEVMDEEL